MTSITFSSKGMKSMYKWALKRNEALSIVLSVILFFAGPFLCFYIMTTRMFKAGYTNAEEILISSNVLYTLAVMFFTLLSGVKTFSFLHNKRSTDMFCSMPCNRTTMFIAHLLGGITAVGVPYVIGSLCVMGICARKKEDLIMCLIAILSNVLMLVASYLLTALVAYCCGTIIDTIIITLAINGIWAAAVLLWFGILSELIPGMVYESVLNTPVIVLFAPYGFGFAGFLSYMYYGGAPNNVFLISLIMWAIILIAIEFAAVFFLSRKRKSEVSQNGFAAGWLPMAIKAGLSVVAGGVFGVIAAMIAENGYGNMYAYVFWYIVGSLCVFFIFHIIFSRGIKKDLGKSAIVYSATTVASLVLVFCMSYGCGIDTYVPSKANVSSVRVTDYYFYSDSEYRDYVYTSDECIELILEMHKVITEGIRKENEYPYYLGTEYNDSYYTYTEEDVIIEDVYEQADEEVSTATSYQEKNYDKYKYLNAMGFTFKYDLKFGFDVSREYYIAQYSSDCYDIDRLNELAKQFMNTDEFKKNNNKRIFNDECREGRNFVKAEICESYYDEYEGTTQDLGKQTINIDDPDFVQGLCEALQKDILADKDYYPYNSWSRRDYSTSSYFTLSLYMAYDKSIDKEYWYYDDFVRAEENKYGVDYYKFFSIRLKDTYTNTWNYLGMSDKSSVDLADIASYIDDYNSYGGNYVEWVSGLSKAWAGYLCRKYEINYTDWSRQYRSEYDTVIYKIAVELLQDPKYSDQTNDDLVKMTQTVLDGADLFVKLSADEMNNGDKLEFNIGDVLGTDSEKDEGTDTSSESKTESKSESKTESKAESSEPTDTNTAQSSAAA